MVMRGNSVKTSAVILVAAVCLVALAQTQQVQADDHCCCKIGSRSIKAYTLCRRYRSVSGCCSTCTGYMSNADCRSGFQDMADSLQGVSETSSSNKVVDYCKMGCMTSVCINMTTSVVGGTDEGKDLMERCTSECNDLCTKDNAKIAEVHGA